MTRQITQRTIEHAVFTSDRPYHELQAALEARMSIVGDIGQVVRQVAAAASSWDEIKHAIEERMGQSGFTIFSKVEQGELLAFAGKPIRACQYAVGNPLLAIAMIEHAPEVALYAPLRITVYEAEGKTHVAYDNFASLVKYYQHPEVAAVAERVEQKLEQLIGNVLGEPAGAGAGS